MSGMKPEVRTDSDRTEQSMALEETSLLVGLPAYNEEVGIGSTILAVQEYVDDVVVVDDGSTDRTVEIARAAGATVLEHETNKGKGGAVKTLFDFADDTDADVFVLLDADGQHLPSDIPNVIEPVLAADADIAIGSRYLESGDDETPRYRRFGQRVLDVLTIGAFGPRLTDTQSGFRAFSTDAIEELQLTTDGIGVETEIIRNAVDKDLSIVEVPVDVRYEGIDGQTHNPLRHGLAIVNFVLRLVRDRHPLLFFALPGLVLVLIGGLYGVDAILIYRATDIFYPGKVLLSGFVTICGVLSVFMGLTLHSISYKIEQLRKE